MLQRLMTFQRARAMSMEGGALGSAAVIDSAMAEAGAVHPDLALTQRMNLSFVSHCPTRMEIFVLHGHTGEVMDIRQQFWII